MHIFKQLYAHIQHNLCAHIQDNSYLKTSICTYSTNIMHIFKLFIYVHIQDNLYMHTFKEIYARTYSRQFIFKTIYICNKEVPGHSIFIYLSGST